jgi:hypothetical protein
MDLRVYGPEVEIPRNTGNLVYTYYIAWKIQIRKNPKHF